MQHIHSAAEVKIRRALAKLPPGRREFVDYLDDESAIRVAITIICTEHNIEQHAMFASLRSIFQAPGPFIQET